MTPCTEEDALSYLQNAFAEHFVPRSKDRIVNRRLDAHTAQYARQIENLASPENEEQVHAHITGSRRRYLEAVRKNAIAKKRYNAAIALTHERTTTVSHDKQQAAGSDQLSIHLELLHQQRRHDKLDILSQYVSELDKLDEELPSATADREHDKMVPTATSAHSSAIDISAVHDMITKLEIAVVRSDHDAKRERSQLDAVQAATESVQGFDPVREAQALLVVRDELTRWIEQNLAQCAEAEIPQEPIDDEAEPTTTEEDVEAHYKEYIAARQWLLDAAALLQAPNQEADRAAVPIASRNVIARKAPPTDTALAAEIAYDRRLIDTDMKQIQDYMATELEKETQESFEGLLRLVDESQLLLQFPVLAKEGRFEKIIGSLGGRTDGETDDKITSQVKAWAFAADAADKTLDGTVKAHVTKARKALDEVDEMLQDLRLLQDHAAG
jgi:hypothetical protein